MLVLVLPLQFASAYRYRAAIYPDFAIWASSSHISYASPAMDTTELSRMLVSLPKSPFLLKRLNLQCGGV